MNFGSLEPFYQNFRVFREEELPDDIGTTIRTAERINHLAEMTIFDEEAIKKLAKTPVNQQIEDYYVFMLKDLIKRNEMFHVLQDKYCLHVLVSDFLEISTNVFDKDAVIIVEWPYIKYMDMLNKEICYAKAEEFAGNVELLLGSFAEKYVRKIKADKSFHLRGDSDPIFFQMRSYMRNVQELFMIGHELGHLLLRDSGHNTEQEADKIAFHALLGYCKQEPKIISFVLRSVMLLFSYMTWLDTVRISRDEAREDAIGQWRQRYDALFDVMVPYYDAMGEKDKEMVDCYEGLCGEIDKIGVSFLEDYWNTWNGSETNE